MSVRLPSYLEMAKPNPMENRAPWYKNTAPTYAGVFLWVVFYMEIGVGTLSQAGVVLSLVGLVIAALICHFLFYVVPGMYGMKTGYPLYVIGSSTYGTAGGFLMPGLLMGLLQFGWLAVNIAVAANFIVQAMGSPSVMEGDAFNGTMVFTCIAVVWGVAAAFIGVKGIQYVSKVATFLPIVPLVMITVVFFVNMDGIGKFQQCCQSGGIVVRTKSDLLASFALGAPAFSVATQVVVMCADYDNFILQDSIRPIDNPDHVSAFGCSVPIMLPPLDVTANRSSGNQAGLAKVSSHKFNRF